MNGKVTTSCILFLLSAWAHAAESNLRGDSRSLAPEPEQFSLFGGVINPLTTFQPDTTPFPPNPTSGSQFRPDGKTTTPTSPFQSLTGVVVTTKTFPSIPVVPFQLASTKVSQFGSPTLDKEPFYDGNAIGGLGLGDSLDEGVSCPKPGGTPCTRECARVSCGGCVYNNSCLAKAADFPEGQCQPVP
jgi:hypothetical protein